ncbi:MAG: hypothetical protein KDN22_17355 [Verrucomicrobiae bacterium]|nr:hypothetical protein [Verrucomicrobiae bacterium]
MNRRLHVVIPVALSFAFVIAAAVVPGWAARDKIGIDAGIAAISCFFLLCGLAILAAIYALVAAVRFRRDFSKSLFYMGILPLPCLLAALAIFWMLASKRQPPQSDQPQSPTKPASSLIAT